MELQRASQRAELARERAEREAQQAQLVGLFLAIYSSATADRYLGSSRISIKNNFREIERHYPVRHIDNFADAQITANTT